MRWGDGDRYLRLSRCNEKEKYKIAALYPVRRVLAKYFDILSICALWGSTPQHNLGSNRIGRQRDKGADAVRLHKAVVTAEWEDGCIWRIATPGPLMLTTGLKMIVTRWIGC